MNITIELLKNELNTTIEKLEKLKLASTAAEARRIELWKVVTYYIENGTEEDFERANEEYETVYDLCNGYDNDLDTLDDRKRLLERMIDNYRYDI